ncbi:MAG: hypothetical protein BYD32DRAFT_463307 [Podila humilis]|nr:MAG: hypothetical protein BYD32DRAFT_463307 [Podila humilis]
MRNGAYRHQIHLSETLQERCQRKENDPTGYVNLKIQSPSGYYPNEVLPLLLDNQTGQPAYVYPSTDCTGAAAQLTAGKADGFKQARSFKLA